MEFDEVAVCYILREHNGEPQVLLGEKKKGLGTGKIVGPGGKLEPGETPEQAIVREVREESGLVVREADLERIGRIDYEFPARPEWSQVSWVFRVSRFSGDVRDSEELRLGWHPVSSIPFDRMWDDAKHWLPAALGGEYCDRRYVFGDDLSTVIAGDVAAGHPGVVGS